MNKKFDTLYARDSKSKILQWNIEIIVNTSSVDIKISYGEYNGGQTITWQRNIQGKNIGKSNETNSYQQAEKDCNSIINNKIKKGYISLISIKENIKEVNSTFKILTPVEDPLYDLLNKGLPKNRLDSSGNIKPMKAQQYYRTKKNWQDPEGKIWDDRKYYYLQNPYKTKESGAVITKFPCIGQPKINGVRCTIQLINNNVIIKSKEGTIYNVAHIQDFLNLNNDIFNYNSIDLILDGELYIYNESLQDIGSAVKKPNLNTPRLLFILFDLAIEEKNNLERINIIKEYIKPKLDEDINAPIEIIKSVKIENDFKAQTFTDNCILKNHEGAIFRQFEGLYAFGKRPQSITKLKRVLDEEFKIIDIIPQQKDNTKGNYVCITKEGNKFDVTPKGIEDFKRELLLNRNNYIGKNLTCVFYEYTNDNIPFHIINNIVRDYE